MHDFKIGQKVRFIDKDSARMQCGEFWGNLLSEHKAEIVENGGVRHDNFKIFFPKHYYSVWVLARQIVPADLTNQTKEHYHPLTRMFLPDKLDKVNPADSLIK